MNEQELRIVDLIEKHLKDELTATEKQELEFWKNQSESNRKIFENLTDNSYLSKAISDGYAENSTEKIRQKINRFIEADEGLVEKKGRLRRIWPRLSVAAAILLLVAVSVVYFPGKKHAPNTEFAQTSGTTPDVAPGGYKATLQLADGRSIVLDSATMGQLAQQGSTQVINKGGQIVYSSNNAKDRGEVLYNTLYTSKGQTYPLILADNSKVWLNAESSVRFPVSFSGNSRNVEITGEVYFEIAHDAAKPFTVSVNGMNVQVLGTKFNINAYSGENAIKTTLIEGSVHVTKGSQRKQLKPGQQAQVIANEIKVSDHVDLDKIIAWKNGYFTFKSDKLEDVMGDIARWYNIEVVFEDNAKKVEINGDIHRSSNLSEVLKILSLLKVESRIEGKKLILKAQ